MKKRFLPLLFLALPLCFVGHNETKYPAILASAERVVVEMGDVIEVEQRTLTYEGESQVVDGQIILPDGTSKMGKSFTVNMPGAYVVNYRAFFGTVEVSVPVEYICNRHSGDLFISSSFNNKPQTGEYSFNTQTNKKQGARLTLDSKTTFTYDGVIDFSSFDPNTPFIEFIVDTSKQGSSDLETFTVRLTDVEDRTNYVDITATDSGPTDDDGKGCYILAGAYNQFKTGYEYGRLWTAKYGTNVGSSFRALPIENPVHSASYYFDYAEKTLYVSPIMYQNTRDIITDLHDRNVYGSTVWEGFTSGKATLSIFANSLASASANIVISRVGDTDLSQMIFEDHNAPVIELDYDGQIPVDLPKATVGKPYKLYNANIVDDFDKDLDYKVLVSYKDTVNNKVKDISVINNSFTPREAGEYTITYHARDYSNNEAKKTVTIYAINDSQSISVSLDQTTIDQALYENLVLPSINDVNIVGGSGKAKVTRRLFDSDNNEIPIEGDDFLPTKVGTYTAYYTAADYIGNIATCTLTINVLKPAKPIFIGDLLIPRIVIKDHTYKLQSYQGVEVIGNETVYLDSAISVNGEPLTNNTFIASDTCHIKYTLTGQTGTSEHEEDIRVVNPGEPLNQEVYFDGNFNVSEEKDYVTLSTSSDASALFASVLPYDSLFVKFDLVRTQMNCRQLVFKYSDNLYPDISLSFRVTFSGNKTYISVGNSDVKYELGRDTQSLKEIYTIEFINSERVLRDTDGKELTLVRYDDNGNPFNGFTRGVYLDISMEGVTSSSNFNILTIANQNFGHLDLHMDLSAPVIIFNNKFINEQNYGDDAYVPSVEVFDVLSDAYGTVSVKGPDGSTKINNQDSSVTHTFKLDAFGSYIVTYKALDNAGNSVSYPRKITVFDIIAPEITVDAKFKESYAINSAISIPSYTVTDNLNDYTLDVFLILPNNEQRLLIIDRNGTVTSYLDANSMIYNSSFKVDANTFRAEQYGTYIMRFVAYDSDFNKSVVEFSFTVK